MQPESPTTSSDPKGGGVGAPTVPRLGAVNETGPAAPRPARAGRFRRVVRIFVSSPGDLAAERQLVAGVAERLQQVPSMRRRFAIQPLLWEREVPPVLGAPAQLMIDRYMAEAGRVELFVMLLGNRLGSPFTHPTTGRSYPSGTEYELDMAYRANRRRWKLWRPRGPVVLVYRCTRPEAAPADPFQSGRVEAFLASFSERYQGIQPKEFRDGATLHDLLYRDLGTVIDQLRGAEVTRRGIGVAAAALIALVAAAIAYVIYVRNEIVRRTQGIVDTALAEEANGGDPERIWERATERLVALGPSAVDPMLGALARRDLTDRVDQMPIVALVRALARAADRGAHGQVCAGFERVLALDGDGPRYSKGTHRNVIREGLARTTCPVQSAGLCGYLGRISSDAFTDHPVDWVDLRDAAALLLGPERAAACMAGRS